MHDFWLYCSIRWLFYICRTLNCTEQTAYFAHLVFVHKRNVCSIRKCEVFVSGQNPCSLPCVCITPHTMSVQLSSFSPMCMCHKQKFPVTSQFSGSKPCCLGSAQNHCNFRSSIEEPSGVPAKSGACAFPTNLIFSLVFHRLAVISVL